MYFSKLDMIDFNKSNKEDIVLLRRDLNNDYYITAYEYYNFNLVENNLYTNIYKDSIKI